MVGIETLGGPALLADRWVYPAQQLAQMLPRLVVQVVQLPRLCRRRVVLSLSRGNLMSSAKQDVESLLHKLPDNSSVEDIQYHLYVLDKERRGLEDAQTNGTLSQEEVEMRLSKWLTE
jgi:hypothetical protein